MRVWLDSAYLGDGVRSGATVNDEERSLQRAKTGAAMSFVRLRGYSTLSCGCIIGHYHELGSERDVSYVEQKGTACPDHQHRNNKTIRPASLSGQMKPPRVSAY